MSGDGELHGAVSHDLCYLSIQLPRLGRNDKLQKCSLLILV
ncbi:MAG: hypothetical protein PVI26_06995 [Chitinispirillia bacterium]